MQLDKKGQIGWNYVVALAVGIILLLVLLYILQQTQAQSGSSLDLLEAIFG